ncbi:MAG: ABC transporter permease [Acidimicrobiia bacterium]|nr:ABC transporter permease [Acidimicrobiia bacterium]
MSRLRSQAFLLPVFSVLLGFAVGAVLIVAEGKSPVRALGAFWSGAFDGRDAFGRTLEKATPLVLTGSAVIVGLRAGLFNIGAQGQLISGALFAAYFGYRVGGLPGPLHAAAALAVGGLFGALPAALAGVLKATRGVHEVISTIMLNTVIVSITEYLAGTPWKAPRAAFPRTPEIQESARIPRVGGLPTGFLLAVLAALLVWFLIDRTTTGFRLVTVGSNRHAAQYAGISVGVVTVGAMALSGFLAGLGGAIESLGVVGHFESNSSGTLGFDGITIALLARVSPRAAIPAALLIGALRAADTALQFQAKVAPEVVDVMLAIILLLVAAPMLVRAVLRLKAERDGGELQLTSGWGS